MNSFYTCMKNETEKLFLKKKTVAAAVVSVAVPVLAAFIIAFFQNRIGIMIVNGASFPVFILGIFTSLIIPLFAAMIAADSFAGEIGDNTIKISLLRPVTRVKLYMSKIAAMGIYIFINLALVLVVSTVLGFFLKGNAFSLGMHLKEILAYAAAVLPMLLFGIMAAVLALFFKSSSGAMTASILVFIALKTVAFIFPNISDLIVTSYANWHLLWLGGIAASGKILSVFLFTLGYSIIFLALGYCIFDRKEF